MNCNNAPIYVCLNKIKYIYYSDNDFNMNSVLFFLFFLKFYSVTTKPSNCLFSLTHNTFT